MYEYTVDVWVGLLDGMICNEVFTKPLGTCCNAGPFGYNLLIGEECLVQHFSLFESLFIIPSGFQASDP
jgi:hypothetical protein